MLTLWPIWDVLIPNYYIREDLLAYELSKEDLSADLRGDRGLS